MTSRQWQSNQEEAASLNGIAPEHVNRRADVLTAVDVWYDLLSVDLRRWSTDTRALIVAARAAVDAAYEAMNRELYAREGRR